MPRPKVESEKLTGRISENHVDIKVIEFVRDKLKKLDQAQLIREAIITLYKHEKGELRKEELEDVIVKALKNVNISVNNSSVQNKSNNIDDKTKKEIENEIEKQIDENGNLDFSF